MLNLKKKKNKLSIFFRVKIIVISEIELILPKGFEAKSFPLEISVEASNSTHSIEVDLL